MARKFKRKTAVKRIRTKETPVLSIDLIGKGYWEKVVVFARRVSAFANNKLTNNQ